MNFLQDLSIDKVRNLAEDAFNQAKPKTEVETRVYEVLSHKNWGASTSLLNQIAKDTFDYDKYAVISELMWQSMENQRPAAWRVVFKALSLLEHLIKNGSERCVDDARNHGHSLRALLQFNYYEGTVDRGLGVREKSKQLIEILSDDERVREERQKARKLREKFGSKIGGVAGGAGNDGFGGGYGGNSGWDSGSSGYGQGGIGSERISSGGGRYDVDPRGPQGVYAGRYDKDRGARTTVSEPTFAAMPDEKRKSSKSKKNSSIEPTPASAPEIDLFDFHVAPASTAAVSPSDDFADFQGSSAQAATDPFAAPATAPDLFQQNDSQAFPLSRQSHAQSFDALQTKGGSSEVMVGGNTGVSSNMTTAGISHNSSGFYATNQSTQGMRSSYNRDEDEDDFGDFAAAQSTKSPISPVKGSDPFGNLVSLDGLSLNSSKKKAEDNLNAPVIANAAAAVYIKEKEQIQQNVQQSKKGNMASFDGLVDLPKQNSGGMNMNFGMTMNTSSLGFNPNVMSHSTVSDAIGTIFDPSNIQSQQQLQHTSAQVQGFVEQQSSVAASSGNSVLMGNNMMNQQQMMMMGPMTPQQQQQMMLMIQQQMMQQQAGFSGHGMENSMGGFK